MHFACREVHDQRELRVISVTPVMVPSTTVDPLTIDVANRLSSPTSTDARCRPLPPSSATSRPPPASTASTVEPTTTGEPAIAPSAACQSLEIEPERATRKAATPSRQGRNTAAAPPPPPAAAPPP